MDTVLEFDAIGTTWRIEFTAPKLIGKSARIKRRIHTTIERFDRSFSRFRDDSWVRHVRANPGTHRLPNDAYELLNLYAEAYRATDGLITPLIGTTMEQAGYDANYSLKSKKLTKVAPFDTAVTFTRHSLTTTTPVLLDFGAAGKGYLVDKIGLVFGRAGIFDFAINAGGDILHHSKHDTPITVGLENPFDTSEAIGTCELGNASICGSSGNRRKWGKFTHIINPKTLVSPTTAAIWVVADTAAVADMVATALFFVSPDRLFGHFEFAYAVLDETMTLTSSKNFRLQAFTEITA